jgi:ferredoxin
MRVHVDPDVCQGHGLCAAVPGVVHLREENGQSHVLSEGVSPQDEVGVPLAARGYPEHATSIT